MSGAEYLKILRESLKQCEEAIRVISDPQDREMEIGNAVVLRNKIRVAEWEQKQETIRLQNKPSEVDEFKCGE